MADKCFGYFTAAEAEQFSFYRMPKALFTEKDFEDISCEAKVLYGMMLDRMGLSIRNRWFDSLGRAYIIFTVEDVMGVMGCGSQKAVRLMKELDTADGIGLIEKKRIGLGRPNRIYVKNFMVRGSNGSEAKDDACRNSGKKETGMPYDTDNFQRREAVHADTSECREPAAAGCMENMDRYDQTESTTTENQNSNRFTFFYKENDVMEKGYGVTDKYLPIEHATEDSGMAPFCTMGEKTGKFRENEREFADKSVETMVKELLCKETAVSNSPKQVMQTVTRQEFSETEEMRFENRDSGIVDTETAELWNAKHNDTEYSETEYSKTEKSETDFSVAYQSCHSYQSDPAGRQNSQDLDVDENRKTDSMEEQMNTYREKIRENISYACFHFPETENVDELVELMVDAMMVPDRHTIRIAGTEKPAAVVKSRFMKLMYSHIEYVLECLNKYAGKIRNIKAYLLTALYNSSLTINSYYRAEVNHDLYGYGD